MDRNHRRQQNHPREGARFVLRVAQKNVTAERMTHADKGLRQRRFYDLVDEDRQVAIVLGESDDVTFARVRQHPFGPALASEVEDGDGEAAAAKIGNHLEILFDEFASPGHDADRAARRSPRRLPQRRAKLQTVIALEIRDYAAAWNGIDRERHELHCDLWRVGQAATRNDNSNLS